MAGSCFDFYRPGQRGEYLPRHGARHSRYLLLGCGVADLAGAIRAIHAGEVAFGPLVAGRIAEQIRREKLTQRELEILQLLILGLSNKAIASETRAGLETVKTHVKTILRKLDARSRTQAVAIARRRGMLPEEVSNRLRQQVRCGPACNRSGQLMISRMGSGT